MKTRNATLLCLVTLFKNKQEDYKTREHCFQWDGQQKFPVGVDSSDFRNCCSTPTCGQEHSPEHVGETTLFLILLVNRLCLCSGLPPGRAESP